MRPCPSLPFSGGPAPHWMQHRQGLLEERLAPERGTQLPAGRMRRPPLGPTSPPPLGFADFVGTWSVLSLRPHIFISFCTNSKTALHREPEHFVHSWSVHFEKFIWRHASSSTKYFFLVGFQVVSILATRKTKSFSLPFKVQLFPGLSSARTTELVLLHYTLNCAFIIFSNLFFFLMRTKQSSNPAWISKTQSWNPVRERRVFCVLLPSLFSLSKIKLFFFRILVLFSRTGRNVTKNSHGVKGITFKKDRSTIFVYFDASRVFLKVIYNIWFKNISPFRMFLPKSSAQKTYQDNLNIIKLSFLFSLEENAALEIILYDKLSNITLMFGWRKEERRKLHLSMIVSKITVNN